MSLQATKSQLFRKKLMLSFVFILCVLFLFTFTSAESVDLESGNSYYAVLETQSQTLNWAGAKIQHNGVNGVDSAVPFTSFTFPTGSIFTLNLDGNNLKDSFHYYAAMLPNSFNLSNMRNTTLADVTSGGMFNAVDFPLFYPDFNDLSDSPLITFTGNGVVTIAEQNFTSVTATIDNGITYHAVKYFDGAKDTVIFLVEIADASCFDFTPCVGQFLLPVNVNPYYFYALSKVKTYDFDIYIDGVQTTTISQTGLPYNLTVDVTGRLNGLPVPDLEVIVGEDEGQNIFIPYHLDGYISSAYSVAKTNADGRQSWLVAPTVYPSFADYVLYVAVVQDNTTAIAPISSITEISVASKDAILFVSKPLSPSLLSDNAKVAVNAMEQIINFALIWANEDLKAKNHVITYSGGFLTAPPNLKTGAINVIRPNLPAGHTLRVYEEGGYLMMNPYTGDSPFDQKRRVDYHVIPSGGQSIVIPTSLGAVISNITFQVLDGSDNVIAEQAATIDSDLEEPTGSDTFYNDDTLKTILNAMDSVINSLFYALNN